MRPDSSEWSVEDVIPFREQIMNWNRSLFVALILILRLTSALHSAEAPAQRPNIVILMADNWAWPHAGACGDRAVKTPTFDRLAREGMLFRNAFCLAPSCAPARAAFLTGQTIHRLEDAANLHGRFSARFPVFTEALERADYFVGYSGKGWGPGNVKESGRTRNPAGTKFDNVAAFLNERPEDKPFCYWFSSRHPHIPWQDGAEQKGAMKLEDVCVPAYLPDDPVVRDNIRDYLCEVQLFDQECAALLAELGEKQQLDNTLIVMTGDNGWQMPHGLAHVYDAGTRIPLAISWPGQIAGGKISEAFVNFDDFAPTFLDLAGLKPFAECTGRSLLPILKSQPEPSERDAVFLSRERHANVRRGDRSYPVRAIRTREFLYVRNFEPDLWPAGDPDVYFAVGDFGDVDFTFTKQHLLEHRDRPDRKRFFEINFGKRPAEELYDLGVDPDQTVNVATDQFYAGVKASLAKRLTEWMRRTSDPRADNPHDDRWDKAPYFGGRPTGTQVPNRVPRADFKILDGQPTRLYFTGNPHHPTFGREKLQSLLDRYFDGKRSVVVDGLADSRKDPLTQTPIKPAKISELIRFLEPVFAARDQQPEPRERLVVLNYVIVEQPRKKALDDWVKGGADALQQYAQTALQRGAQRVFFSEMVQPNHIQGGPSGNKYRRAGLQVFDELTRRKLNGIERGPLLQTRMEQHPHFFRDDRHYSDAGRDYIGLLWFESLLQHDALAVPKWCQQEIDALQSRRDP